jgi:hypothetical protein
MEESLWLSCKTSDFGGRHCLSKEVAGEYILSVYKVVTTKLYILASCYNILNNLTVNSKAGCSRAATVATDTTLT